MKIIGDISVIGIRDPGTKDERVVLRALNDTTTEWYALVNVKRNEDAKINILNDKVFWFSPAIDVKSGDIIRLYTQKTGDYKKTLEKYGDKSTPFHNFYWGLNDNVWDMANSNAVTVFKIQSWATQGKG